MLSGTTSVGRNVEIDLGVGLRCQDGRLHFMLIIRVPGVLGGRGQVLVLGRLLAFKSIVVKNVRELVAYKVTRLAVLPP